MTDIDFIKWMCDKAENWNMIIYDETDIEIIPPNKSDDEDFFTDIGSFMSHYAYPLLLQRAIEGINTSYGGDKLNILHRYSIQRKRWCFRIEKHGSTLWHTEWYDTIDQAKESALRYIYEQEAPEPLNA